jgi:hypothetical protein
MTSYGAIGGFRALSLYAPRRRTGTAVAEARAGPGPCPVPYKIPFVAATYPGRHARGTAGVESALAKLLGDNLLSVSATVRPSGTTEALLEVRTPPSSIAIGGNAPVWAIIDDKALPQQLDAALTLAAYLRERIAAAAEACREADRASRIARAQLRFEIDDETAEHADEDGSRPIATGSRCTTPGIHSRPHYYIAYRDSVFRTNQSNDQLGDSDDASDGDPPPRASFNLAAAYNALDSDSCPRLDPSETWTVISRWIADQADRGYRTHAVLYAVWLSAADPILLDRAAESESPLSEDGEEAPAALLPSPLRPCAVYIRTAPTWRFARQWYKRWEPLGTPCSWAYSPFDLGAVSLEDIKIRDRREGVSDLLLEWSQDPPRRPSWYNFETHEIIYVSPFHYPPGDWHSRRAGRVPVIRIPGSARPVIGSRIPKSARPVIGSRIPSSARPVIGSRIPVSARPATESRERHQN